MVKEHAVDDELILSFQHKAGSCHEIERVRINQTMNSPTQADELAQDGSEGSLCVLALVANLKLNLVVVGNI